MGTTVINPLETLRSLLLTLYSGRSGDFFKHLVRLVRDQFGAPLVDIWDNNAETGYLTLQASFPDLPHLFTCLTIPYSSFTGAAVTHREIRIHQMGDPPLDQRVFFNPALLEYVKPRMMVSLPIVQPSRPDRVAAVLNLYLGEESRIEVAEASAPLHWLCDAFGAAMDFAMLKAHEEVREYVAAGAPSATGIASLFDQIYEELGARTHSSMATLYSVRGQPPELRVERSRPEVALAQPDTIAAELLDRCVAGREPLVVAAEAGEAGSERFPLIAAPIFSSSDDVIGVLQCSDLNRLHLQFSFSLQDVHALQCFARALAPAMERFLRTREGSSLMTILGSVAPSAVVSTVNLEDLLQRIIVSIAGHLNASSGAVFVREHGSTGVQYRLRAGLGRYAPMVGLASYAPGEGLTGRVANGEVLVFKTLAERRMSPGWQGKFDALAKASPEPESYLAVPIRIGDSVVGVWKVEDLRPSPGHPEPYFTDEDVQTARVLSVLIAGAIDNHWHKQLTVRALTAVAQTAIGIEAAGTEDDAIASICKASVDCGLGEPIVLFYEATREALVYKHHAGAGWDVLTSYCRSIHEHDVFISCLNKNHAVQVGDAGPDSPYDPELAALIPGVSQQIVPLTVGSDRIGVLAVRVPKEDLLDEERTLAIHALASHLTMAISRIRTVQQSLDAHNQIVSSSRFIVAETLSGMAVHSLGHTLKDLIEKMDSALKQQDIRARREMLQFLTEWRSRMEQERQNIEAALNLVKNTADSSSTSDVNVTIQQTIKMWITLLDHHGCRLANHLDVESPVCSIPPHWLREIVSVLLVNSVQAHAKCISISTEISEKLGLPGNFIRRALLIQFTDDGVGFVTSTPEEVFEATYTTKPNKFGTGLGLFIARRLARKAGGDLIARNRSDQKGAVFLLALPLTRKSGGSK